MGCADETRTTGYALTERACEHCRATPAKRAPIMTAYPWDGVGQNPNEPPVLCAVCLEDYVQHWQEQWAEYNSTVRG